MIAEELNRLDSPNQASFYTSGKTTNEPAFLLQLFARQFGTNNLPDCSNMCHESSGVSMVETLGIGKGTATLEDMESTDLIFIFGNNPGTNHPRMLTSLQKAKEHGAKIIAVNPLPEVSMMRVKNPNPQDYKNPLELPIALLGNGGADRVKVQNFIKQGNPQFASDKKEDLALDEAAAKDSKLQAAYIEAVKSAGLHAA
jgi:NADH dehydrogenase/NADH:ubiquinone oxidoreductase subunit G